MKKFFLNYFAFKFLLLPSISVYGDANEAFMKVTATIEPSCTVTVSNLNFGPYNLAASHETATIALLCTNGTKFRIELGAGNSPGATVANRNMLSNGNLLKYSLYQDTDMRRPWGSGTSNSLSGDGTGKLQYYKVYGRIAEKQQLPAGLYSDTILISINIDGLSGFGYQLAIGMNVAARILK